MKKHVLCIVLIILARSLFAKTAPLPAWFMHVYQQQKLNQEFELTAYRSPAFLEADFNGDGIKDIAALIIEKRTHKKGVLLIEAKSKHYFVFGAGTLTGKKKVDIRDDFKWVDTWGVYDKPTAYETRVNIKKEVMSIKRNIPNKGINLWAIDDDDPQYGELIYWNSKQYVWINQGV